MPKTKSTTEETGRKTEKADTWQKIETTTNQKKNHVTASAIPMEETPSIADVQKPTANTARPVVIQTENFNRASYLLAMGGKLIKMDGTYPDYLYEIEVLPHVAWYEKNVGLINYKEFINQRIKLKIQQRRQSGLPINFVGKTAGFTFGDMATFKDSASVEAWKKMIKPKKRQT